MSELREADEAVQQRQEAISEALARATGLSKLDIYRHLFIGMDVDAGEAHDLALEHADASCVLAIESVDAGIEVVLADYVAASWMDGFSVAAMLFMRRREGR